MSLHNKSGNPRTAELDSSSSTYTEHSLRTLVTPSTVVDGLFKCSLRKQSLKKSLRLARSSSEFSRVWARSPRTASDSKSGGQYAGLEQSTNCRWWNCDTLQPRSFGRSALKISPHSSVWDSHFNCAYSFFASRRSAVSGSASFHNAKKSS